MGERPGLRTVKTAWSVAVTLRASAVSLLLGVVAGTTLLSAGDSAVSAERCEAKIIETLGAQGVPQSDVQSIKVTRAGGGGKSPTNSSYDAWVRLKTCSGYLMLALTRSCYVQDTYTKGDCQISGMPGY